ncbi:MAG: DUF2085 domain-containing protein [Chloroflexota bacterium]
MESDHMITVTLFGREGCHLCDYVREMLGELQTEVPHELVEIDIERDGDLTAAYGSDIPVVEVGPYSVRFPFTRQDLLMTLRAARDRVSQFEKLEDKQFAEQRKRGQSISRLDRLAYWFSRHYLLVFNLLVIVYVGLPFAAPVLMKVGASRPARVIYFIYGMLCHQLAFRSWFLFGEQPFYPRAAAGVVGVIPYGEATGLSEFDVVTAAKFIGNELLGYKVALCQRDVAIYAGILLFGLIFALSKRRLPSLHWSLWFLLGILPIGIDGLTQVMSQPPINLLPYRESMPLLRTFTGLSFGFFNAWLGYPMIEEAMADTRRFMAAKFQRLRLDLGVKG